MTDQNKDAVGYRRPPKSSQWKKGQTGNPRKARKPPGKRLWQVIEEILARDINVSENGQKRQVSAHEGILFQLWASASSGNAAAVRALRKYEAFAKSMPDIYVIKEDDIQEAPNRFAATLKAPK